MSFFYTFSWTVHFARRLIRYVIMALRLYLLLDLPQLPGQWYLIGHANQAANKEIEPVSPCYCLYLQHQNYLQPL